MKAAEVTTGGTAPTAPETDLRPDRRLSSESYLPIESYGVIGDMQALALVGLNGSIDYFCLPRFDSPSVFAALLDHERGGFFRIQPALDGARLKQLYLPNTNVLLTRFLSEEGVAEISDFMPVHEAPTPTRLVRRLKTVRGDVHFQVRCAPRFDYARASHTIERSEDGITFVCETGMRLQLVSSVDLSIDGDDVVAEFHLRHGESAWFILEHAIAGEPSVAGDDHYVSTAFKETVNFWRHWIGHSTYRGRWRDEVHRSALTLKLLHCRHSGAVVAAATFGLPETLGGVRNWDYRYTWIRDASFTLYALNRLGMTDETTSFITWLRGQAEALDDPGELQTLYAIDGRSHLPEETLGHLEGYRGSQPVRIGNDAHDQLQLDIYGELIDALYLHDKYGESTSWHLWQSIAAIVDWVCEHWEAPDEGIWEIRTERRHHLYSRIMCWVAIDRGIRLAVKRSLPAPLEKWRRQRDTIYHDVMERFWDPEEQTFVGVRDSRTLDAACLVMPLVRFISPTDPRWLSTLRAVERRLVDDSLVYRYEIEGVETDGLEGAEGTFSICSFWYVECLSRAGDLQQARFLLEKMLGYANHLGLYAEEVGPSGEHLGNFPQAFTHLALISAAFDLDRRLSGAGWTA